MVASAAVFVAGIRSVSGLVPFEFQLISTVADRYAYLCRLVRRLCRRPSAGANFSQRRWSRFWWFLVVLSFCQTQMWKDDTTLWTHANQVNPRYLLQSHRVSRPWNRELTQPPSVSRGGSHLNPVRNNGQQGMALIQRIQGDAPSAERWYRDAMRFTSLILTPATDLLSLLATTGGLMRPLSLANGLSRSLQIMPMRGTTSAGRIFRSSSWTMPSAACVRQSRDHPPAPSTGILCTWTGARTERK